MTTAYTSLLGLALPTTGELQGTWGDTVNNSITSLLDTAVAGTTTLSTDGDVTLSTTTGAANQARQAILLCSGARTAQRTITAPAASKIYTVINATTGGVAFATDRSFVIIGDNGLPVISVDMGPARLDWRDIPVREACDTNHLPVGAGPLQDPVGTSMGNPHATFFVAERLYGIDVTQVQEIAKVEAYPRMEGRQMLMVLAPK